MISHFTILTFSHVLLSGCRQFRVDHVDMKLFKPIVFVFPYNYFFLNSKLIFWNGFFEEITVAWNVCPGNREIYLINSPKIIKRDQMHTFPPVNNVKWFGSYALTDAASPNAGCGGAERKACTSHWSQGQIQLLSQDLSLGFWAKAKREVLGTRLDLASLWGYAFRSAPYTTGIAHVRKHIRHKESWHQVVHAKKKLVPQLACCRFPRALNYNGLFQCIFQGQITFRLGVFGCVAYWRIPKSSFQLLLVVIQSNLKVLTECLSPIPQFYKVRVVPMTINLPSYFKKSQCIEHLSTFYPVWRYGLMSTEYNFTDLLISRSPLAKSFELFEEYPWNVTSFIISVSFITKWAFEESFVLFYSSKDMEGTIQATAAHKAKCTRVYAF